MADFVNEDEILPAVRPVAVAGQGEFALAPLVEITEGKLAVHDEFAALGMLGIRAEVNHEFRFDFVFPLAVRRVLLALVAAHGASAVAVKHGLPCVGVALRFLGRAEVFALLLERR